MTRTVCITLAAVAATGGPAAAQVVSPLTAYAQYGGLPPVVPTAIATSTPFVSPFAPTLPVPPSLAGIVPGAPVISTPVATSTPVLSPFSSAPVFGGGFASAAPPTASVPTATFGRAVRAGVWAMPVRSAAPPIPYPSGAFPGGGFGFGP
jgi:hypothetical protein